MNATQQMARAERMDRMSEIRDRAIETLALIAIEEEYEKACTKYPLWPEDPVHAAGIVTEEAGELIQAALDHTYHDLNHHDGDTLKRMEKEAIQTVAMALRFLVNLSKYRKFDKRENNNG